MAAALLSEFIWKKGSVSGPCNMLPYRKILLRVPISASVEHRKGEFAIAYRAVSPVWGS